MARTTILLIRHADVHNPDDIVYGRLPRFRLSEDGRAQAEATADALAREPIAAFYASPMLRTRQTARILAARHPGVPVHVSTHLIEVQTSWQGTPWAQMGEETNLYEPLVSPGDESIRDVGERMVRFLCRLVERHRGETVACVSHADPVMIAKVQLLGIELSLTSIREGDYPERASVTRLEFGEGGKLADVRYGNPAQHLIKPAQRRKREAPAEASGEAAAG